jgi:hypothetical protein
LLDFPLDGQVSGHCSFDVGADHVEANGEVEVEGLKIDHKTIGNGSASLKLGDEHAEANVRIGTGKSTIELVANSGLVWTEGGLELDPRRGGMLRATVGDFDLAWTRRLVRGIATNLSGKLSGRGEVEWGAADASGARPTTLRANAIASDATIKVASGGVSVRDVKVKALADGDGPLRLAFSGSARSRATNVTGTAMVNFDGPRLKRLDAEIEAKAFPLVSGGVVAGYATTGPKTPLEISIVSSDDASTLEITIPAVEIGLPKTSNKGLIALDHDGSVDVADAPPIVEPEAVTTNATSNRTLTVRLGNDVRVTRGALEVPLGGSVTVARNGRLTGTIAFRQGGVVPALGQLFRIRRGLVRFEDQEPTAGTIAIQAWTRVADGTVVDLDVSGTVENPVVGFHSDPPRSEDEIVAILLGVQGDTVYKPSRNESRQVGRTAMALAMNRLLRDSALSGLQFGAGETGEGDTVSTVSLRVGSKVWLEGRSVRGSQTSVNPSDRVSGVVDWRFAPTWSLRSQLGEVSGVEIRWSLRY